jgi:hypothetical protein
MYEGQMSIKYTNILHCKTLRKFAKLDFWFENIPSGNPARVQEQIVFFSSFVKNSFFTLWTLAAASREGLSYYFFLLRIRVTG